MPSAPRHVFCLPAPLIFGPPAIEIAGKEPQQGLIIPMRLGEVRPHRESLVVARQRLVEPL
jgi:hypothetical protein